MPNELAYLPLYVSDLLVAVSTWPLDRFGAYMLMLLYQWEHGGLPADDEAELARIIHTSRPHTRRLWTAVAGKFVRHDDGLYRNARLEKERAWARHKVDVLHQRAVAAAAARWNTQGMHEHNGSNTQGMRSKPNQEERTPPTPPPAGGRSRRRRVNRFAITPEQSAQMERTREVARLMREEGLTIAEAARRVEGRS